MAGGGPKGHLELSNGLLEQAHLHVCRTEIVVGPNIVGGDVLLEGQSLRALASLARSPTSADSSQALAAGRHWLTIGIIVGAAFRLAAERLPDGSLEIVWDIAPDYYLYRHRLDSFVTRCLA